MSTTGFQLEAPGRRSREVPSWWLLRERVIPDPKDVSRAREKIRKELSQLREGGKCKKLEKVFNPDSLRHQLPLASEDPLILLLMAALATAGHLSSREAGRSVSLYSEPGCEQQPWHADYDPICKARRKRKHESAEDQQCREEQQQAKHANIRSMRDCQKPLGVFWAVEEGCRLMVVGPQGESVEVHLQQGEVLLFHGDLVHAGAAYPERDNMRVHLYLHAKGVAPPNGNTYYVKEFVPVSHVQWSSSDRPAEL